MSLVGSAVHGMTAHEGAGRRAPPGGSYTAARDSGAGGASAADLPCIHRPFSTCADR